MISKILAVGLVLVTAFGLQQGPAPTPARGLQAADTSRFVAHTRHINAGGIAPRDTVVLPNPFVNEAAAIAEGARLYISYNCIDCHGADGTGAMAPAFIDGRWHFGGSPLEVYESIAQGRPGGMPAWGGYLDRYSTWRLVAYVRSLEKGKDVSTENFTGKAVERMGH